MKYDAMLYLMFFPSENIFLDDCGMQIQNIFKMITPNDLYLYRQDPGYNIFPCRFDPHIGVEIIDNEYYFEGFGYDEIFDAGDDLERIERYERAKAYHGSGY